MVEDTLPQLHCAQRWILSSRKITLSAQRGKQPEMLLFCKYTAYRVSHCITEYHWQSQSKDWPRQKESWRHINYDVIISFTDVAVATFGPFRLSFMSLRKTERFWVKRSLFFVNKVLSIPSIRFSNLQKIVLKGIQGGQTKSDQVIMAALLSACWEAITWSRKFWWKKRLETKRGIFIVFQRTTWK